MTEQMTEQKTEQKKIHDSRRHKIQFLPGLPLGGACALALSALVGCGGVGGDSLPPPGTPPGTPPAAPVPPPVRGGARLGLQDDQAAGAPARCNGPFRERHRPTTESRGR